MAVTAYLSSKQLLPVNFDHSVSLCLTVPTGTTISPMPVLFWANVSEVGWNESHYWGHVSFPTLVWKFRGFVFPLFSQPPPPKYLFIIRLFIIIKCKQVLLDHPFFHKHHIIPFNKSTEITGMHRRLTCKEWYNIGYIIKKHLSSSRKPLSLSQTK